MDLEKIKKCAIELEASLTKYGKTDRNAKRLHDSLKDILEDAKQGRITTALEYADVPGTYFFNERNLSTYRDLSKNYSKFKIEVTGGDRKYGDLRNFIKSL